MSEAFFSALQDAIAAWSRPIDDEWLFAQFREDYVLSLSCEEAFLLIDPVVDVLLEQTDESVALQVLYLLGDLAGTSDTTQRPIGLSSKTPLLKNLFDGFSEYSKNEFAHLLHFYRYLP